MWLGRSRFLLDDKLSSPLCYLVLGVGLLSASSLPLPFLKSVMLLNGWRCLIVVRVPVVEPLSWPERPKHPLAMVWLRWEQA
jgi:hypothetical protein